ncbi:MAG: class I SAM-dependent methyltransferase [Endomicrobium sp.]|jgi:SAM-dependent methyltransferase|nr:class I SAM-dependent methyltransferase [Endomicrobium sp.]
MNSKIEFENIEQCLICGGKNFRTLFQRKDFDISNFGTFDITECVSCKMLYTLQRPTKETLHLLYQTRNTSNFDESNRIFERLKTFFSKRQIKKYIGKLKTVPKTFVDFGCGNALYAISMKQLFPNSQVYAVDFAKEVPEKLKGLGNIDYLFTDDFLKDGAKYDVIFLRHVLEHTLNPLELLKQLKEKISAGGSLIIEVPNAFSGQSRVFGKFSHSWYAPYHTNHFTYNNIKELFKNLDFARVDYSRAEMPFMSNTLANMFGKKINNVFRIAGMLLHPLQLAVDIFSPAVITVIAKK